MIGHSRNHYRGLTARHPLKTHWLLDRGRCVILCERYFQGKVYLKNGRAHEHLFLTNKFQKCSNSVPLIGGGGVPPGRLRLPSFLYNGRILVESSKKKVKTKTRKSQAVNMGAGKQYSSINFHGGLIEGISNRKFL